MEYTTETGKTKGFSLIESLICMFLFLLVTMHCMVVVRTSHSHFTKLKNSETAHADAYAALDRIKTDAREAGKGLFLPIQQGWLRGIEEDNGLIIRYAEQDFHPPITLEKGQTWIPTDVVSHLKTGQEIGFLTEDSGELHTITGVKESGFSINAPLSRQYPDRNTSLLRIQKIFIFWDKNQEILRRKVNASPAQPLCEGINHFSFSYSRESNLLITRLGLDAEENITHEFNLFPKNTGFIRKDG